MKRCSAKVGTRECEMVEGLLYIHPIPRVSAAHPGDRAMQLSFNNDTERNETRKLYEEARRKMMQRAAEAGQ